MLIIVSLLAILTSQSVLFAVSAEVICTNAIPNRATVQKKVSDKSQVQLYRLESVSGLYASFRFLLATALIGI